MASKNDLFGTECMSKIVADLHLKNPSEAKLRAFQRDLRRLGRKFQRIISRTPLKFPQSPADLSLTRRIEWLDANVLNPSERLIKALEHQNRHMFSTWPDDEPFPPLPNLPQLRKSVRQLHLFARALRTQLGYYQKKRASLTQELRFIVVSDLTEVLLKHFPEVSFSRGTAQPRHGMVGPYPAFVRRAFREITGLHEQLDDPIRDVVDSHRRFNKSRLKMPAKVTLTSTN